MTTYTVIWRDAGDDYMFTVVNTDTHPNDMSWIDWVLLAADVEYASWDALEREEAKDYLKDDGYYLLDVVHGTLVSVL